MAQSSDKLHFCVNLDVRISWYFFFIIIIYFSDALVDRCVFWFKENPVYALSSVGGVLLLLLGIVALNVIPGEAKKDKKRKKKS